MSKRSMKILLVFCLTFMSSHILLAKDQPELISPGGAEMDFAQNITKCYGTKTKPVEAHWQSMLMKAQYLEYDRNQNIIRGQELELIESKPVTRVFKCDEGEYWLVL